MSLVIIDVGAGNLHSVQKAFAHVMGDSAAIGVTTNPSELAEASRIVLPGVGAFGDCMQGLHALSGMRRALETAVLKNGTPFLGICVGMQMLFQRSHEHGIHEGLGWLEGEVVPLTHATLPIPHMGWNALHATQNGHPLLHALAPSDHAYFVHSFHATSTQHGSVLATVDYGGDIVAMVAQQNIAGMQFHPEKSQAVGLQLLRNFIGWQP